jgi:hypothetical protein
MKQSAALAAKELEKLSKDDNRDQITAEIRTASDKVRRLLQLLKSQIPYY